MAAVLTHEIQYVADVSRLTRAVGDARKQFNGANTGLDKLAQTTDHIASKLQHAATNAGKVQRLGRLGLGGKPAAAPTPAPAAPAPAAGGSASGGGGGGAGFLGKLASATIVASAVADAGRSFAASVGDVLTTADKAGKSRIFDPATYQRMAYAAGFTDTSIEQIEKGAAKLSAQLTTAQLSPELLRGFKALGVTAKELKALKPDEQIELIADRLSQFQDEGTRLNIAKKVFGEEQGASLLQFLSQGGDAIRKAGDDAERFGLVLSDETVAGAEATNDAIAALGGRLQGIKTQLVGALVPTLLDFADGLGETLDGFLSDLQEIAHTAAGLIAPAIESVTEIMSMLGEVAADAIGPVSDFLLPALTVAIEGVQDIAFQIIDTLYDLADSLGFTGEESTALADAGSYAAEILGWLFDQASMVLDILAELAGIFFEVGALVWDLVAGIEDATGLFSGFATLIQDTVGGALGFIRDTLEDITELFDLFGSGEWEKGFLKLGNALLDFILEPLRALVRDIIWVADAISEDLVPDSVRAFADNTRERANAFADDETQSTRKSRREKREEDRAERKRKQDEAEAAAAAEREAAKRERGEQKVSKARMDALNQEGRKLSGPGLVSLGARDEKGRNISVWLGRRLDTQAVAAAANRLSLPPGAELGSPRMPVHTPARAVAPVAAPGLGARPMAQIAAAAASAAPRPVPNVTIERIEVHTSGDTPAAQLRDYARQIREVTREEVSRQIVNAQNILNPGGLLG